MNTADDIAEEENNLEIIAVQSRTEEITLADVDIGTWPESMMDYIDHWLKMGSSKIQHCDAAIITERSVKQMDADRVRICTTGMFLRKLKNGKTVKREWLCFSPKDGKLYCFLCKLLCTIQTQFSHGGFSDWKNATNRISNHEMSSAHLNA